MIKQAQDVYTWCIVYQDDVLLHEDDAGQGFASIQQERQVKMLTLLPLQGGKPHYVDIPQGATPVFFRRRSIEINPLQGESTPRPTTHCIGWKRGDEATYLFVFDDGSTLLTDNLQAI
jgi:hypothetical protein